MSFARASCSLCPDAHRVRLAHREERSSHHRQVPAATPISRSQSPLELDEPRDIYTMGLDRGALAVAILASTPGLAQEPRPVGITQIWQSFMASRFAALKCNGIDRAPDAHFLANLNDVTIRATQSLEQSSPEKRPEEVVNSMKAAEDGVHDKVDQGDTAERLCIRAHPPAPRHV